MTSLAARAAQWQRLADPAGHDLLVVGGGATGLAVALEAVQRGLRVALVEAGDFACGTSSRSTKLLHGGVRYLAQGRLGLVREALAERARLLRAAPHLGAPLPFLLPVRGARGRWVERWTWEAGLRVYDALAGTARLESTRWLGVAAALEASPGLDARGLSGALRYVDGQFEDARLALALARSAAHRGAAVLNHCAAVELLHERGRVCGVVAEDRATGHRARVRAGCVVNATGVWVDRLRDQDTPEAPPLVTVSQGLHLVLGREFLPGGHALLAPRTRDGRVLFAIPWLGHTLLGTTDTARTDAPLAPEPLPGEVDLVLSEAAQLLGRAPARRDVRSVWCGLRPLAATGTRAAATASVSREHEVHTSPTGLVSVTGGKWTTCWRMAADTLAACQASGRLPSPRPVAAMALRLHGAPPGMADASALTRPPGLRLYGTDAPRVQALPGADAEVAPGLTEAMVRFAAREEMALGVEDVLARRHRLLFLDARAAREAAPRVARILEEELGPAFDAAASCDAFTALAARYTCPA